MAYSTNDSELVPEATIKKYLIVQNEGGRRLTGDTLSPVGCIQEKKYE